MHPQWDGAVEVRGLTAAYNACGLGGGDRMRCTRSNGRVVEIGGLTATSTHAAWRGRPHASYALGREGRNTIWLNELFRGFAVYNVLAGKVTIG